MRGFCHMQKPLTKISIEVKLRNDLTFLVVINFCMDALCFKFFQIKSNPFPSQHMPKEVHLFLGKFAFHPISKKH